MEDHLRAFVSLLKGMLGRRLLRVYFVESEEEGPLAEANLVILVEDRDWTEDYIIHQEGARLMRETGSYLAPIVVSERKWEHWRRQGREFVARVEREGRALYDREWRE